MNRLLLTVLIAACFIRVITQYVYAKAYYAGNGAAFEQVYYDGQAAFELMAFWAIKVLVSRFAADYIMAIVSFFFYLCLFQLIKEAVFNPLNWFPGEETMAKISFVVAVFEVLIRKVTMKKINHLIKLLK